MRAHQVSVSVALAALVTILIVAGVLAFALTGSRVDATDDDPRAFVVECTWSHRASDDPIVHPGHVGASHAHDFFGSAETDARSTATDLIGTSTTCQTPADTAAYWAPTLLDGERPVDPGRLFAYYRTPRGVDPEDIEPHPFGLALVAGDAQARGTQPLDIVAWHCGASTELSTAPPTCPRDAPLTLRIAFPSCWNGTELDSSDHRSHVAYPTAEGCPRDHPRPLPELVLDIAYSFWGSPSDLRLASGPTHSAHGDFLNAWDPDELRARVETCLRRGEQCGIQPNRASIAS